ncbi:unnamed protein product [Rotaria sp. Silwood2]|nr:unnamed protein product [Rotaria sp. Silwood2]CAF4500568.1 unnamed protein product [Rotaria sp. Silwood2]
MNTDEEDHKKFKEFNRYLYHYLENNGFKKSSDVAAKVKPVKVNENKLLRIWLFKNIENEINTKKRENNVFGEAKNNIINTRQTTINLNDHFETKDERIQ